MQEINSNNLLNQNPLDLIEADPVVSASIRTGGAGGFVVRHLLGYFELAAVAQIFRDPGGAEAVAADFCADAGLDGPAADHAVNVRLRHGFFRELVCSPAHGAEEVAFRDLFDLRALDIGLQVVVKVMVAGHLVALAALFMEAHPCAAALHIDILLVMSGFA